MDPQIEAMFQAQEQQISDLTQRVAQAEQRIAELEQRAEHMRDMMSHLADHAGVSHPGIGER
jgi:predicted  nucleic acid-binding Zn-ribbon protein